MEATEAKDPRATPRRLVRMTVVLTIVGLLVLVPVAAGVLSALQTGSSGPRDGPSGLSAAWEKPINFIESGLATGTSWSVNLSGSLMSSTGTEITFSEIPGTYAFTVTPVPGYTVSPSSGSVKLTSCEASVTVYVTFAPVPVPTSYTVWFNETGLPTGTTWWANLSGTNTSASSASISFSVLNGTYAFSTPGNISGLPGVLFNTTVTSGSVVVNGANVTVMVPYATEYLLTMIASPPGGGSVTPASGWYGSGSSVALSESPTTGYLFINWTGSGSGNYSGTNPTPTITMNGPITENATFGQLYAVDFEEAGLPDGTTWSVTFNGMTQSAYFVFLDFSATNGTFPYSVAPISGYHADSYHGLVTVSGSDVTVVISWSRVTYNVTFIESGLPGGTMWSVTLNGSTKSLATSAIDFVVPNGTLPWSVAPVSGYTANVTSGTVVVQGANVDVYIGWTVVSQVAKSYTVSFVEAGLPTGTGWSVTLNGSGSTSVSSSSDTVTFSGVADGSYIYWVPDVGSYLPATSSAGVDVSGANVTVDVSFATLQPALHPPTVQAISVWDLLIIGFIAGGAIVVTYAIFRRT